jgi:hypothetical protein
MLIETLIEAFIIVAKAAIVILIQAIILRAAAKWVLEEDILFGNAYVTAFISCLNYIVIDLVVSELVVRFVVGAATQPMDVVNTIIFPIMLPVWFLIQAGIISWRLKTSFRKACLVLLAMIAMIFWILLIVFYGLFFISS